MRWIAILATAGLLLATTTVYAAQGSVTRIQRTTTYWEIEISGSQPFPMGAQRLFLKIGTRTFMRSIPKRDLKIVVFYLTDQEYASVSSGNAMSVSYGPGSSQTSWSLPPLDKNMAGGVK
jgi:hypothetical protein